MQIDFTKIVMRFLRCDSPTYETGESPRSTVTEDVGHISTTPPFNQTMLCQLGPYFE